LVACSDKIGVELGWKPKYTRLDDIVASAWEWHRERH
jgi:UDP-glucose 4-epimerase